MEILDREHRIRLLKIGCGDSQTLNEIYNQFYGDKITNMNWHVIEMIDTLDIAFFIDAEVSGEHKLGSDIDLIDIGLNHIAEHFNPDTNTSRFAEAIGIIIFHEIGHAWSPGDGSCSDPAQCPDNCEYCLACGKIMNCST